MILPTSKLPEELEKVKSKYTLTNARRQAALKEIDTYLADRVEESFQSRRSPDGKPWPGQATLVKTGGLFAAATAPGEIREGVLRRKTKHKLAGILQYGARKPKKKKKRRAGGSKKPGGVMAAIRAAKIAQKIAKIAADAASGKITAAAFAAIQELRAATKGRKRKRKRRKRRKGGFRIPPRPFEGMTEGDGKHIAAIVLKHATGGK